MRRKSTVRSMTVTENGITGKRWAREHKSGILLYRVKPGVVSSTPVNGNLIYHRTTGTKYSTDTFTWRLDLLVNTLISINQVALRRARLLLGRVTVCGLVTV